VAAGGLAAIANQRVELECIDSSSCNRVLALKIRYNHKDSPVQQRAESTIIMILVYGPVDHTTEALHEVECIAHCIEHITSTYGPDIPTYIVGDLNTNLRANISGKDHLWSDIIDSENLHCISQADRSTRL